MSSYPALTLTGECVFCKIIAGSLRTPGIFWENSAFVAWLAIDPNTLGFSCVVPKAHVPSDILKMPDANLYAFMSAAKTVASILEGYFPDVGRVGLIMEGTGIDHAHIKLVPMHGTEDLKRGSWRQYLSGKQQWSDTYEGWISSIGGPKADEDDLVILATNLKEYVRGIQ